MKKSGFTLIELLVVIAIIGILAGIAYPNYMQHVLKSRRSEAQSTLIELANRQEMYYLDHHAYATNLDTDLGLGANPFVSENGYYSIATSSSTSTARTDFTLTATVAGTQTNDTDCKTLSITQDLTKTATNSAGNAVTDCWK